MKVNPYASAIGSIKYAMLCTKPIVYLAMSLAKGYNSDPGLDHWIVVMTQKYRGSIVALFDK